MDKLVSILTSNPLVTLLAAAVLILVFMFLFKNTIKQYLIKKFDLYDEKSVKHFASVMTIVQQNTKKDADKLIDGLFEEFKRENSTTNPLKAVRLAKKIMKARAVLLMILIGMISFTGFANHTDPRQNSDVDDIVCLNADSITTSGVASVEIGLQNTNFSYVHSVAGSDTIMIIINSKQFNQVTFSDYPITYVDKGIRTYLFKPLATIRPVNLYDKNRFNTKINNEKRCNCWLTKLVRNPRDGLQII